MYSLFNGSLPGEETGSSRTISPSSSSRDNQRLKMNIVSSLVLLSINFTLGNRMFVNKRIKCKRTSF